MSSVITIGLVEFRIQYNSNESDQNKEPNIWIEEMMRKFKCKMRNTRCRRTEKAFSMNFKFINALTVPELKVENVVPSDVKISYDNHCILLVEYWYQNLYVFDLDTKQYKYYVSLEFPNPLYLCVEENYDGNYHDALIVSFESQQQVYKYDLRELLGLSQHNRSINALWKSSECDQPKGMAVLYLNDFAMMNEAFVNRNIIFICDFMQQGIHAVKSSSGQLLTTIKLHDIPLVKPLDICILNGDVIFTNGTPTDCVHILRNCDPFYVTLDYQCVATVGRHGKKEGTFSEPCNIICEQSTGKLIVSDTWNDRVQIFQYSSHRNETTLQFWNCFGNRKEKTFRNPQGLCLNRLNGELLVCDSGNGCIHIYQ
ncbi:hypothetical protein C9374_011644 [Naegleria lovaniensis]|uniref:Uncharacterized protein n=1 Tax=Naegleria lovaniensis TaxID=51637 RepID=A0AA88GG45_NAELO|nr:uncharacterized protein C9374_011644 [Naegleria lovaniensis]KAG2373979.1 hypothetical protein C9374_011644 [Naegleria lovaniensis]